MVFKILRKILTKKIKWNRLIWNMVFKKQKKNKILSYKIQKKNKIKSIKIMENTHPKEY